MPVGKKSIQRAINAQNNTEQPVHKAPEKKEPELTVIELSAIGSEVGANIVASERLKSSMREYGVIEPILVVCDGKTCRLADGRKRYLAAKALGWTKIPAIVIQGDKSVFETLQRELNASVCREEAPSCNDIHEEKFRMISRISSEVSVELL